VPPRGEHDLDKSVAERGLLRKYLGHSSFSVSWLIEEFYIILDSEGKIQL